MEIKIEVFSGQYYEELFYLIDLNIPTYFAAEEKDHFKQYLEEEIEDYYVLFADNKIIGCGGINYDDPQTAVITWDMMHPEYQGQGLGSKLLQYRLSKIKENEEIDNVTVRTSQMAQSFYAKNGFKLLEVKKDFWAKGFDLYLMKYDVK